MSVIIFLHVHLCTVYWPGTCGGQKTIPDIQELALQVVVSSYMNAEN